MRALSTSAAVCFFLIVATPGCDSDDPLSESTADTATVDSAVHDSLATDTALADTAAGDTAVVDTSSPDTASPDTASADTASPDTATSLDAADTGGACNALVLTGPDEPDEYRLTSTPPTYGGGTIVDGTYVMVNHIYYGQAEPAGGPKTSRAKIVISGGTIQFLAKFGSDPTEKRTSFTFTTAGADLSLNVTCPGAGASTQLYQATPTTFQYRTPGATVSEALTFWKE